jgi:hypothetical protein
MNSEIKQCSLKVGAKVIPLLNKTTLIGKNPNLTVCIEDPSIAKEHAAI